MPIVDIALTKLEAHREDPVKDEDLKEGIKVNSQTNIDKISKDKFGSLGEALFIDYSYNVQYTPNVGGIEVKGQLVFYAKKLSQVCENKDGKITLNPETFEQVQNAILANSAVQSIILAKEIKLPPSISLPRVQVQPTDSKEKTAA
jgi:hypothetical protein